MNLPEQTTIVHIPKGTILLWQGDLCTQAYQVMSGCLKSYVIDSRGKEHILQFAPEGWVISDMNSALNRKPSEIFIDAVEDSMVIKINPSSIFELKEYSSEIIHKLMKNIIARETRLISLLSRSAEERYQEFQQTYPTLARRLPQKLIASYLGITPEYLSEVRRKAAGK